MLVNVHSTIMEALEVQLTEGYCKSNELEELSSWMLQIMNKYDLCYRKLKQRLLCGITPHRGSVAGGRVGNSHPPCQYGRERPGSLCTATLCFGGPSSLSSNGSDSLDCCHPSSGSDWAKLAWLGGVMVYLVASYWHRCRSVLLPRCVWRLSFHIPWGCCNAWLKCMHSYRQHRTETRKDIYSISFLWYGHGSIPEAGHCGPHIPCTCCTVQLHLDRILLGLFHLYSYILHLC